MLKKNACIVYPVVPVVSVQLFKEYYLLNAYVWEKYTAVYMGN